MLNTVQHYNDTEGAMSETDWNRNREQLTIKDIRITSLNKLNITLENRGSVSSHLVWLGIFNKTVTPESQNYFALNEQVEPAETKSILSDFSVVRGKRHVIQIITELGNAVESKFYPASSVNLALTLVAVSPTTYVGNNATVLLTVTNNDTEVDIVQNVTVSLQIDQPALVQVKEQPTTFTLESLVHGQSAFFRWIYNTITTGTATFNATYDQAPAGVFAVSAVTIESAPSGGQGQVTITGQNGSAVYHSSLWNLLGGTQFISGSISDLVDNDSNPLIFQSYYTGSDVNINHFVNNTSNVDGLADKGTHSNFTAQQYGPDSIYDTLTEEMSSGSSTAYYPSSYNLLGSTQLVSGSLTDLQTDDGIYMAFRSYQTASSSKTLYAHSETTSIGGTSYYLQKTTSADGTATSLSASMSSVGRQLFGKFVYPLTGVTSIPASTWTMYYRAWRDSGPSIVFDMNSSVVSSGAVTSFSWSHVTGSGSNRLMVVGVSIRDGTVSVLNITYGTQNMTKIRSDVRTANLIRSELWYLIAPSSGTATITVTLSGSSRVVGGACTYAGVAQTSPIDANNGGSGLSSSPSQSVTVNTAGSWLLGHIAIYGSSATVSSEGAGQLWKWDGAHGTGSGGSRCRGHGSEKGPVSAGVQSLSWSLSSSVDWAVSVVALKAAAPVGHADINILIRQADGTVRATLATDAAPSGDLSSSVATLQGTYSWASYSIVNQTDYLEIDYYVDVTTAVSGVNAYLRIDDSSLAIADQTKATNVMLPSEYTVEIEFLGTSNIDAWTQLVWTLDSSFTAEVVSATFQLYNYTAGTYSTIGDGYMADTIGTVDVTKIQTISLNPAQFRDASGNWRLKVKGVKATSDQFDWRGDLVKYAVSSGSYVLDLEVQWTGAEFSQTNEMLCIYGGTMGSEDVRVDAWNGSAWQNLFTDLSAGWNNVSVSSYLTSSVFTTRFNGGIETSDGTQDSWNIDVSLLHLWMTTDQCTAEVEFVGSSNLESWTELAWFVDSCWDVGQVTVTIQFYNFTLGAYVSSGNGYANYVSTATPNIDELQSQNVTLNLSDFKNATGHWQAKIKGVKATATQFLMKVDWIEIRPIYTSSGVTISYGAWQWCTLFERLLQTDQPFPMLTFLFTQMAQA
jgi:hypothetical protein